MKYARILRLSGMIVILIILLIYLNLRDLPNTDVPQLQYFTMLIAAIFTLSMMSAIYILDKANRKAILLSIATIILILILAVFIH